jgi:hypothetical protein
MVMFQYKCCFRKTSKCGILFNGFLAFVILKNKSLRECHGVFGVVQLACNLVASIMYPVVTKLFPSDCGVSCSRL